VRLKAKVLHPLAPDLQNKVILFAVVSILPVEAIMDQQSQNVQHGLQEDQSQQDIQNQSNKGQCQPEIDQDQQKCIPLDQNHLSFDASTRVGTFVLQILSQLHQLESTKEFDLLRHQKELAIVINENANDVNIHESEDPANIAPLNDFVLSHKDTDLVSLGKETEQSELLSDSNQCNSKDVSRQHEKKLSLITRDSNPERSDLVCFAAILSSIAAAIQYRDSSQRRHSTNISRAFVKGLTAFPESNLDSNSLKDSDFLNKPAQLGLNCAQSIDSFGSHHELPFMPVSV